MICHSNKCHSNNVNVVNDDDGDDDDDELHHSTFISIHQQQHSEGFFDYAAYPQPQGRTNSALSVTAPHGMCPHYHYMPFSDDGMYQVIAILMV